MVNQPIEKSKIGPKEAEVRALREARVAKNKRKIDKNVREIATVLKIKGKPPKGKTVKVVQFKKRGRSGR